MIRNVRAALFRATGNTLALLIELLVFAYLWSAAINEGTTVTLLLAVGVMYATRPQLWNTEVET